MQLISLPDLNDFVVRVVLEEVIYRLHFSWNDRGGFWCLGVRDGNNNQIIESIKCVKNFPLLEQFKGASIVVPSGELVCIVLDKIDGIGRNDFINGRSVLTYFTESEVKGFGSV